MRKAIKVFVVDQEIHAKAKAAAAHAGVKLQPWVAAVVRWAIANNFRPTPSKAARKAG